MTNKAVIGLGFGDEGKGMTTNYLCSQSENPLVVRFSGGSQAGHTVVYGDDRHVFSHFGSGTLRGCDTLWSRFCTVDPMALYNEYCVLDDIGIQPTIYISDESPITTPYDKKINQLSTKTKRHGTCGVGFGETIKREENHFHLHFEDIFNEPVFDLKFQMICDYYKISSTELGIEEFLACCNFIRESKYIKPAPSLDQKKYCNWVFEGSQGLLLDQHYGFFPHVTRSNTGTKNINKGHTFHPYLITRAYQTRHGAGPMTNEHIPHGIKTNPNETNVDNEYQGKFRRSILDLIRTINKFS